MTAIGTERGLQGNAMVSPDFVEMNTTLVAELEVCRDVVAAGWTAPPIGPADNFRHNFRRSSDPH